jgi:hypothetical protein
MVVNFSNAWLGGVLMKKILCLTALLVFLGFSLAYAAGLYGWANSSSSDLSQASSSAASSSGPGYASGSAASSSGLGQASGSTASSSGLCGGAWGSSQSSSPGICGGAWGSSQSSNSGMICGGNWGSTNSSSGLCGVWGSSYDSGPPELWDFTVDVEFWDPFIGW